MYQDINFSYKNHTLGYLSESLIVKHLLKGEPYLEVGYYYEKYDCIVHGQNKILTNIVSWKLENSIMLWQHAQ